MSYHVEFTASAARQLAKLSAVVQNRLKPHIDSLPENPLPPGVKKLAGPDHFYRIRVGDYRIIYQIKNDILTILVVKIGRRKDVYKRLKR
ncbi:MAG: type II toxin-antitoxin system RelE/ParE family toxin [Deltaproteobacteria bacterium]|nr:type II toxin-antitoxin system RelE/ParE family toxin [Deltaproteobacteria bacterium]MBF0527029.1 type II toxin-antitoxin system RelE/ParE family toxin [Deltaproteobacteria bacterium]